VASLFNVKNMHQKKAQLIGHNNWRKRECNLLNPKSVFLARGCVMIFDPREAILDYVLGHDHVSLTIFYYLGNILAIMIIWKWLLPHTTMEGFSLKELYT
jgi:hypothetical protein